MPTNPTYPGVYIEEIPSGVQTIVGVATSIGAFFGRTAKGPLNKAVRCFNYSDFTRVFGGAHTSSDLAQSLRQFFNNGGTDTYVIRLAHGAKAASVNLKAQLDTSTLKNVLKATANAEGKWGNTVRLVVDYETPNPDETFNLEVIYEKDGKAETTETFTGLSMDPGSSRFAPTFVTQSSNLIKLEAHGDMKVGSDPLGEIKKVTNSFNGFSQARRPLSKSSPAKTVGETLVDLIEPSSSTETPRYKFDISVNDAAFKTVDLSNILADLKAATPPTEPQIAGYIKDEIEDVIKDVDAGLTVTCSLDNVTNLGYILTIASNSGDKSSVRVRRASENDIAEALMLGLDQGGIEPVRWSNFRPLPNASFLNYVTFDGTNVDLDAVDDVAVMKQSDFNGIVIDSDTVSLTGDYKIATTAGGDRWFKNKSTSTTTVHDNNDGIREKLAIIKNAINAETDLKYKAELWGYHLAIIATSGNVNKKPADIKTKKAAADATTALATNLLENVRQYSLGTSSTGTYSAAGDPGDDGSAPKKSDYVGNKTKQTGFHALDNVDIFNLMVLPDDEEVDFADIIGPASIYCEKKRAFLLIDAPKSWTNKTTGLADVVYDTVKVDKLRASVTNKSSAVFYPRLKYKSNGLNKLIGPSGAIAGLMARTDADRGVWKAPAGTEADIRGILGLEVKLTDMENGVLNKLAINCLREFPGSYVCWGSRTMDGYDNNTKDDWKYIPVRRLTLFLEESLYRGTKWVVFEPNDEPLWAKIRLNVGAFMMRLFKQGAFQGSTPDKAFYVKCDSETTPQADINLGIVNIEVGFAPLKPAEFVIIKIQQMVGEL
jgi:phage tail sheath protein FI